MNNFAVLIVIYGKGFQRPTLKNPWSLPFQIRNNIHNYTTLSRRCPINKSVDASALYNKNEHSEKLFNLLSRWNLKKYQMSKYFCMTICSSESTCCHEFMAPWRIITVCGWDDWIYWHCLLQSRLITINLLPRTRSIRSHLLQSDLTRFYTTYIVSSRTYRKHIRCPSMNICERNRKHLFLYCIHSMWHSNTSYPMVACVLRSLPGNRCPIVPRVCIYRNVFSDPLPNNGHAADHIENTSCHNFSIVGCAYFGLCLEMALHVTILHPDTQFSLALFSNCPDNRGSLIYWI
jgi:hypothetical protein